MPSTPRSPRFVIPTLSLLGAAVLTGVIASRPAGAQNAQNLPFVMLQPSTPGTTQSGHAHLSGTVIVGLFSGSGAGLTGVPWSSVTGAPTSFPPNGPAGGDLAGAFPNPDIALNVVDSSNLTSDAGSLNKVTGGNMSVNGSFVGIGASNPIGSSRFVVSQTTTGFGGMYVNTSAAGEPFYGYSMGGAIIAYSYVDGDDSNTWKLHNNSGDVVNVTAGGLVGIGVATPGAKLTVKGAGGAGMRVTAGADSSAGDFSLSTAFRCSTNAGDGFYGATDKPGGYGVIGHAAGDLGRGVYGRADDVNGYGVYGRAVQPTAWAGYFEGKVNVSGTLSKGGGSFKIDHPLDPANKYLYHSFVESPDMMNIYNGTVTTDARGYATVTMPDWFQALNRDFRYSLTVVDATDSDSFVQVKVVKPMKDNRFTLRTSAPRTTVSWMVTGVRQDGFANAHRIPVEEDKPADERGTYLYPTEIGRPASMSLGEMHERRSARVARP